LGVFAETCDELWSSEQDMVYMMAIRTVDSWPRVRKLLLFAVEDVLGEVCSKFERSNFGTFFRKIEDDEVTAIVSCGTTAACADIR
jgi:hypothetical protein